MGLRRRSLFAWPEWREASDETIALVRLGEQHLNAAPPEMEARTEAWLATRPLATGAGYPAELGLSHPLAERFSARLAPRPVEDGRSLQERRVLDQFGERLADAIVADDPHDFTRGLATLASHGLGRRVCPRRRLVGTQRDLEGEQIAFPPAEQIAERLALVHGRMGEAAVPALYRAAVGMAAISNCHPFEDGNGRTARMLFSAVVRRAYGRPAFYAPLHELTTLSGGSLTLALREAEVHGRWAPLFRFVERCLFLMAGDLRPERPLSAASVEINSELPFGVLRAIQD
ncbi:Fic family protein [Caulobacter sp. 602-2]|uniref:Fic family protein n=1 Tax=Caulobacter sp. 602-2 TaxID=2710887 RepID=A0A6G4R1Y9_9CAUL|nr:Fic family protein [Caulobacter sp. 602-2]